MHNREQESRGRGERGKKGERERGGERKVEESE